MKPPLDPAMVSIELYTRNNCRPCRMLKEWMVSGPREIQPLLQKVTECNIDELPAARDFLISQKVKSVPCLMVTMVYSDDDERTLQYIGESAIMDFFEDELETYRSEW